ncbi:MAG: hypothetical protein A2X77_04665 [Gammaproteobacteria bacterium GWE2_42_36]|nr:MAG: hypothetical protein A2X77_04665 [Gammaproteobacteria bacterium GWE2_42_36]
MLVFDFFNPFSQEQGNSNLTLKFNPVELSASCTLNLAKNDYQAANRDKNIPFLNSRYIKDPKQNATFITLDFGFSLKTIGIFFADLERIYNHLVPPNQLRFFEQKNFYRCTLQESIELIIFTIKSKIILQKCVIPLEFTEACNQFLSPKKPSAIHVLFFNTSPFPLQLSPPDSVGYDDKSTSSYSSNSNDSSSSSSPASAVAAPIQKTGQSASGTERSARR